MILRTDAMPRTLYFAALITVAMTGSSLGQNSNDSSRTSEGVLGPTYLMGDAHANSGPEVASAASDELLSLIVLWLARKFDFRTDNTLPQVQLVEPAALVSLGRREPGTEGNNRSVEIDSFKPGDARDYLAIYDDAHKVIYLTRGWTGRTAAEASILVHEMVHHLQNISGEKFECPEAREKAAYSAQEAWLEMFGSNLEKQLDIDPFTQLVLTTCKY